MSKLRVTLEKFQKYAESQGGYDIFVDNDHVVISFVPVFQEALEKGDAPPPRVVMTGKLSNGVLDIQKVEVENASSSFERSLEESELIYKGWLDFIEENF